jgi:hypothetical protein
VFLSCGPYVLKQLLARVEEKGGPCKQWLKWIKKIELEWVTFPNLRSYPPERSGGQDEWWWERDEQEVDVDYVRGAQYNGHYDEHNYEGGYYDDNFYGAEDESLYPAWPVNDGSSSNPASDVDVFGVANHYPFADPSAEEPAHDVMAAHDEDTKLDLVISMEVRPLFEYLSTPAFSISSITVPLYFLSKNQHDHRAATRPSRTLPVKVRYWVRVCVHALLMLRNSPCLEEVRVKYLPWDIWASMNPAGSLPRMVEKGIWFKDGEDEDDEREGEGEAFRAVWSKLQEQHGLCKENDRMDLDVDIKFLKWEGDLDKWRVGDELEVVFRNRSSGQVPDIGEKAG